MGSERVAFSLTSESLSRLARITTKFGTTRSRLFNAVISVMTDEQIEEMLKRYARLQMLELEIKGSAGENLLKFIRGKTVEQIESMIAAAERAEVPK